MRTIISLTILSILPSCGHKKTENKADIQIGDGGGTGGFVPTSPGITAESLSCFQGGQTDVVRGTAAKTYTAVGYYAGAMYCKDSIAKITYSDGVGGTIPCTEANPTCDNLIPESYYNASGGIITAGVRFFSLM